MSTVLSGKELFDQLNKEDWESILPRLHYYALNKLERFPALSELYDVPGLSAQLADQAVESLWDETRKWNTEYYDTAYDFLKGAVDSLISNYTKSKTVANTIALPDYDQFDLQYGVSSNPEDAYIAKEMEEEIAQILRTDADAAQVFECLRDGLKPREVAVELDIDINEIYNILKRLQRKLKVYVQKNSR